MIRQTPVGEILRRSTKLDKYLRNFSSYHFEQHNSDSFVSSIYALEILKQKSILENQRIVQTLTALCQPFLYYDEKTCKLSCGGVLDYNSSNKTGTFLWQTANWRLKVKNVHSYYVYAKMYRGEKYLVLDQVNVPESKDLEDIYVAASIRTGGRYDLVIYHNDTVIFEKADIYPELRVLFRDFGIYKSKPTYVRYATVKGKHEFNNFLFSFDTLNEYCLDNSSNVPSAFIEYSSEQKEWDRFSNVINGKKGAFSVFLHLTNSKTSQVLGEFLKTADKTEVIENTFEDDTSVNLKVTFVNRPEDIRFLYYCAYKEPELLGSSIMGIQMSELEKGTLNHEHEHRYITGVDGIDIQYYKKIVRELYKRCDEPIRVSQLPKKIYDSCINSRDMAVYIYQYLRDSYSGIYKAGYINTRKEIKPKEEFQKEIERYNQIFQNLATNGGYSGKWKSELSLYQMIKKEYPDAIYQYHSSWLGRQSLDIFVPSISTGFEYQGRQHYEAVEFFGGEDALKRRIELDKKKRELCKEQGIHLVEWEYYEPITKMLLKKKMSIR